MREFEIKKHDENKYPRYVVQFTNGLRPVSQMTPHQIRVNAFTAEVEPWKSYLELPILYIDSNTQEVVFVE